MRTNPRYSRVRSMITDPSVPRDENGILRLCHYHQREVHRHGGFLKMLAAHLHFMAKRAAAGRDAA